MKAERKYYFAGDDLESKTVLVLVFMFALPFTGGSNALLWLDNMKLIGHVSRRCKSGDRVSVILGLPKRIKIKGKS